MFMRSDVSKGSTCPAPSRFGNSRAIQGENFDSGGGVSSRANVAFGPTKTNSFTPDTFATLKIYLKMRFLLRFRPCAAVGEGLAALPVLPSWIQ